MKVNACAILAATIASGLKPHIFEDKLQERAWCKLRLAQALRTFGNRGYDEEIAGHVKARDAIETECFWANPWGLHFKLIQLEDLLLVHFEGKILQAGKYLLNTAAFLIHSKIHAARPDIICAAHSHSLYGKAFSALGKPLDMISQDSYTFYNDHAVYTDYRGINHSLLVASDMIEAAVWFYISLEKACQVQLLADAAGKKVKISSEQAAETGSKVGNKTAGWFSGQMEFAFLESEEQNSFVYLKE
ncbi:arad-like aldolase/epimerase [Guyanagaster necrorhizus]|uniref:Arad-like aldolase/epimerase n=1 Tax=Guyanagaster necrorhizus TaxID=856835 RepID=A0A9P7VMU5_9AGAR|nr:arad-like aldolase/epimerase [Guyanagaster necrorhizus MCA 3950]KAG7443522.1 arad-like aldolase/epimerase [Guyanagaster necrorhizus MCA 3950]